uniref:Uncharacterized protein n=1 Tax=Ditylum brightwellii TaxID=49249 RepID=A0A7S4R775_9STRA
MEANVTNAGSSNEQQQPQLTPSQLRLQQMINMQHAQQREAQKRMSLDHTMTSSFRSESEDNGIASHHTPSSTPPPPSFSPHHQQQQQQQRHHSMPPVAQGDMHYHSYNHQGGGGNGYPPPPQEQRPSPTAAAVPAGAITMGEGEVYFPVNVSQQQQQHQRQLPPPSPQIQHPYLNVSRGPPPPTTAPARAPPTMVPLSGGGGGVRGGDVAKRRGYENDDIDAPVDNAAVYQNQAVNPYSTYQMIDPDQNTPPPNIMGQMPLPPQQPYPNPEFQPLNDPNHHQTHQFHYGNPDNQNYYDNYPDPDQPYMGGFNVGGKSSSLCCITACFKSIIAYILGAENLHRSFCFGAIDGMLTGSGIVSACAGLGLVDITSPLSTRLTVIALTLAACSSDGICMAIGHIWSTYVLHSAALTERREEKENFEKNRADAKARLVDTLLCRGMLKIDAMSVADTLEGYPDVFVSALVGDAGGHTLGSGPEGEVGLRGSGSSSGLMNPEDGYFSHGHYPGGGGGGGRMGRTSNYYESYGQFDEYKEDPDKHILDTAIMDSEKEGFIMMLSFCMFSVVPSSIYCFIPMFLNHVGNGDTGISPPSLCITLTSTIMLLLGIWKSKFFDSSWIVFGIETVLVLLVCIMTAYGIGYGLASVIDVSTI